MSRLVSRILLSIFMFPLAALLYIFVMLLAEQSLRGSSTNYRWREAEMFLFSGGLTWAAVAIYWCLLWRSGVLWNSFRVRGTIVAALAAALIGILAGGCSGSLIGNGGESFGAFVGGVLAVVLWLIATVFIWRETTAERGERVKASSPSAIMCPTCGYNLTGLTESRCPECGSRFTLDELLALQSGADREIE